jgi:hypothetical protein
MGLISETTVGARSFMTGVMLFLRSFIRTIESFLGGISPIPVPAPVHIPYQPRPSEGFPPATATEPHIRVGRRG